MQIKKSSSETKRLSYLRLLKNERHNSFNFLTSLTTLVTIPSLS